MAAPPSIRQGRSVKLRTEIAQELLISHSNEDCSFDVYEVLRQICNQDVEGTAKTHQASLLNILSKHLERKEGYDLEINLEHLFLCLRISLVNENKAVRASALRLIRLCLHDRSSVAVLIDTQTHHFIAKCLDITLENMGERVQALRLCRKMLMLDSTIFPIELGRSIVALASEGSKEKDRLVRASLALLGELCILNPSVFVASGGIQSFVTAILDCPSPRMQESLIGALLFLLNTEHRRKISGLNLQFLIAPYSDFHYKHNIDVGDTNINNSSVPNEDRELRLTCAKQALLSVLRSWPGLLHVISCNILRDFVQVLLPSHLETRKAMLDLFYTLLRLPLPEWTDEFSVALRATDPSRVQDAWKLQEGFVAMEGKALLPHVSKFRPNLILNHTALLVYCLVEAGIVHTLVEVIVTSDTFISVRATILLGELIHLSSILLPPACHGMKVCLPTLISYITSLQCDSIKSHRAAQAAAALAKVHVLKKKEVRPHSLILKQIIELEQKESKILEQTKKPQEAATSQTSESTQENRTNGDLDNDVRINKDADGILNSLLKDSAVLTQKDPLLWNWHVLSNIFMWTKINSYTLDDSGFRTFLRRIVQFYKPSHNQFCHSELSNKKTRLYSSVGCHLMDFLSFREEEDYEKIVSEFLEDLSIYIRSISLTSSAHDCLFSPGRLATTACQDYFLFIGRLSSSNSGITALEKAGIFQDLLELVASTNHDCYLKLIVSNLNYHTDGYARAILKKVLNGNVESGRIYATNHLRILLRVTVQEGTAAAFAKWAIPLLVNQLKDSCRVVVTTAIDILDEATDHLTFIEALIPLQTQLNNQIQQKDQYHLSCRGNLLLVKILSLPSGFKMWQETSVTESSSTSLLQHELDKWMDHFNVRYVQMVESDLADGLTQHQRADDGRFGRLTNARHMVRDLPVPPHLLSQLNRHREGLDFLRMSGQLSKLFSTISSGVVHTEENVTQLKAAIWAAAHLGTSEPGVSLLESSGVVQSIIDIATSSSVLALRGTAFYALNLIATTAAGIENLSKNGWVSIKRNHGELWHVVDESEWSINEDQGATVNRNEYYQRNRCRTTSQSSNYSVTFASDFGLTSFAKGLLPVTSTPRSMDNDTGLNLWEVDSPAYSFEGSSVHFDSEPSEYSESSVQDADRTRRAYTLPPTTQSGMDYVAHVRSFSDSHYPPEDLENVDPPQLRRASMETRIWNKLRSSFRLGKSKRWSLVNRSKKRESPSASLPSSPVQIVHYESSTVDQNHSGGTEEESPSSEEDQLLPSLQCESRLNRIGSVLSHLKSVPYKKSLSSSTASNTWAPSYIGLCLPIRLSSLYPDKDVFEKHKSYFTPSQATFIDDEFQHEKSHCLLCSKRKCEENTNQEDKSQEERILVRKELLRLVSNMGSSVGLNANEQGLLRLKQRFPWAFHDICLFSDVCHVLGTYGYRLRARRFLHELFMDSPFAELYSEALSILKGREKQEAEKLDQ